MQFAVFSRIAHPTPAAPSALETAEAQGYAAAWLGEAAHPQAGARGAIRLAMAGLAARTDRIGLVAAMTLAGSTHPVRLAEEIAALDIMSGGRFHWSAAPPDAESNALPGPFREQLTVLARALSGERFSHAGASFQIPEVQCLPAPERQPHPRPAIWLDAPDGDLARFAVANGHPVVVGPTTTLREIEQAPDLGRHGLSLVRFIHVASRDAQARGAIRAVESPPGGPDLARVAIVGDAVRCRERIAELLERTGADTLIAWHDFATQGFATQGFAARSAGTAGLGAAGLGARAPGSLGSETDGGAIPRAAAAASQRRLVEDVAPAFG